ncbi:ATP-binding protein [Kitasatospora sp. NPDC057015]|uniref:ATP-binding protein n=1 Tax=Kitasatospora sp. NPDC057015 TaxID=3346001 RepID=UPI00363A444A
MAEFSGKVGPGGLGFEFVGRQEELRVVLAALRQEPVVVLVEGEAGVGKSRLLREVTERLENEGMTTLTGWCHPLREPLPFGPVIDALRRARPDAGAPLGPATAVLAPYLPELADRLPAETDTGGAADLHRRLMRAVHDLLSALGPIVLAVEDVHWADDATRELLLLLARNPPQQLRLLLTYRARYLPGHGNVLGSPYRRPVGVGGTEISLAPFDHAEVRELADAAIGPTAAAAVAPQLYERSGGFALVVEADLLILADRSTQGPLGRLEALKGLTDLGVPRALQEAVNSRVAALPEDAVAIVQAASVLGVSAEEKLLGQLSGLGEERTEAALVAALQAGILRETSADRYGFRHVLARQVVHQRILGPRRRRLHRRAIEMLSRQAPTPLVQIAYHARQLGDVAVWLPRAWAAAEHAVDVGDDGVAADLLQQLIVETALPPEQRTRAAVELSRVAGRRTDFAAGLAVLRRIVSDPALAESARGEIRLGLARALLNQGDFEGFDQMGRAAEELAADRPGLAAIALAFLCHGALLDRTAAQDRAGMEEAVRMAAGGDPRARATVLASRVTLLSSLADPQTEPLLRQLPRRSADLEIQRQCARALRNVASNVGRIGRIEDAGVLLREAEDLAHHSGYGQMEDACVLTRLFFDYEQGNWEHLAERIEAIVPSTAGGSNFRVEPYLLLALLDIARGQWARARSALVTHQMPWATRESALMGGAALARIDLLEQRPQQARATARRALGLQRHKGVWIWGTDLVPVAVQAALACGRREEAQELTTEAAGGIAGLDAPAAQAEVLLCQGLLAADTDTAEAARLLAQARIGFEDIGWVYRAARSAEQSGRVLLAENGAEADRLLQHAYEVFTRIGAASDAAHCQRVLRDSGRRPANRGRRAYGHQLSPREQEVAGLLAAGATNQDIAQALALSVRTAERHVANTLKKLGVTRDRVHEALTPP